MGWQKHCISLTCCGGSCRDSNTLCKASCTLWGLPQLLPGRLGSTMQQCWGFQALGMKYDGWESGEMEVPTYYFFTFTHILPNPRRVIFGKTFSIVFPPTGQHSANSCVSCGQLSNIPSQMWFFSPFYFRDLKLHPFLQCFNINCFRLYLLRVL